MRDLFNRVIGFLRNNVIVMITILVLFFLYLICLVLDLVYFIGFTTFIGVNNIVPKEVNTFTIFMSGAFQLIVWGVFIISWGYIRFIRSNDGVGSLDNKIGYLTKELLLIFNIIVSMAFGFVFIQAYAIWGTVLTFTFFELVYIEPRKRIRYPKGGVKVIIDEEEMKPF
jgi:hypothetical protein